MRTNRKTLKWTLWLTTFALMLTVLAGVSASGGDSLGTSPFDFSDATYRAHGIVPENIVLRVGTAARAGDFVIDNTNTDPKRANVRTIETTPGTTGLPIWNSPAPRICRTAWGRTGCPPLAASQTICAS